MLRVKAARPAQRLTVAPVIVSCLVLGSIERVPVEKSMSPSGGLRSSTPLGSVAMDLQGVLVEVQRSKFRAGQAGARPRDLPLRRPPGVASPLFLVIALTAGRLQLAGAEVGGDRVPPDTGKVNAPAGAICMTAGATGGDAARSEMQCWGSLVANAPVDVRVEGHRSRYPGRPATASGIGRHRDDRAERLTGLHAAARRLASRPSPSCRRRALFSALSPLCGDRGADVRDRGAPAVPRDLAAAETAEAIDEVLAHLGDDRAAPATEQRGRRRWRRGRRPERAW